MLVFGLSRKKKSLCFLIYLSGQFHLYCGATVLLFVLNLISLTAICFSSLLMILMSSTGLSFQMQQHFSI